jgi:CRISPR-associated protein Cas2
MPPPAAPLRPAPRWIVVCYDIADARRLRRVARAMGNWGDRVQKSVFECFLSPRQQAQMLAQIRPLIDPARDSVRLYPLCPTCADRRDALGCSPVAQIPDVFIV